MSELPSFGDSFELRVTLRDIHPPIWRSVIVPADMPLAALHEVLQVAFGWQNSHLHDFEVAGIRFAEVSDDDADEMLAVDEQGAPLGAVAHEGSTFLYRYDYGDDWEHDVLVERLRSDGGGPLITCTGGARACPPEDCGGVPGYLNLVKALADATHPEHQELRTWVGPRYSSEHFDAAAVNKQLAALTKELLPDE